nr:unnamed protein product [Digitaria exilis]
MACACTCLPRRTSPSSAQARTVLPSANWSGAVPVLSMDEKRPSASAQRLFCACAAMTAAQETGFLSGIPSNTAQDGVAGEPGAIRGGSDDVAVDEAGVREGAEAGAGRDERGVGGGGERGGGGGRERLEGAQGGGEPARVVELYDGGVGVLHLRAAAALAGQPELEEAMGDAAAGTKRLAR